MSEAGVMTARCFTEPSSRKGLQSVLTGFIMTEASALAASKLVSEPLRAKRTMAWFS
jgi:hypothetical protein